jgi:methylmalonyl-CoA/ethylmalonyl-CoA epimerase
MGLEQTFRFHHLGIAVADLPGAIPVFQALFGYQTVSGPFDDPVQKVSVCFLSRGSGDVDLELVAPLGAGSPIDRILRQGGGAYHVCYEVPDIRQAIAHLNANKCVTLSAPVQAVAFDRRMIAWLWTPTRQLIELVEV